MKLCNIAGDKKKVISIEASLPTQYTALMKALYGMHATKRKCLFIYRERFFNPDKNCVNNQ